MTNQSFPSIWCSTNRLLLLPQFYRWGSAWRACEPICPTQWAWRAVWYCNNERSWHSIWYLGGQGYAKSRLTQPIVMDLVVVQTVDSANLVKDLSYPARSTPRRRFRLVFAICPSRLYAWESEAIVLLATVLGLQQSRHRRKSGSVDEIIEIQHPAELIDSGWHFSVRGLNLNNYSHEEVWLTADQINNPTHSLEMYTPHTTRRSCSLFAFISSLTLMPWWR